MSGYIFLAIAIVAEVAGTTALNMTEQFTKVVPSVFAVLCYGLAAYCLSQVMKTIPVGTAYAIWAGLGIFLIALMSAIIFKQIPDLAAVIGMTLIVAGVIVINLFSKTAVH